MVRRQQTEVKLRQLGAALNGSNVLFNKPIKWIHLLEAFVITTTYLLLRASWGGTMYHRFGRFTIVRRGQPDPK